MRSSLVLAAKELPMIKNGWYCCPHCKKKLFPIESDTIVQNLNYKCKACKHDLKVNIQRQEPKGA